MNGQVFDSRALPVFAFFVCRSSRWWIVGHLPWKSLHLSQFPWNVLSCPPFFWAVQGRWPRNESPPQSLLGFALSPTWKCNLRAYITTYRSQLTSSYSMSMSIARIVLMQHGAEGCQVVVEGQLRPTSDICDCCLQKEFPLHGDQPYKIAFNIHFNVS